jgi:cytochrome P450
MLTLLRHPEVLDRLRREPDLVITVVALTELARRLENPRLLQDPPPYRQNATLHGPRHLLVEIDGVRD